MPAKARGILEEAMQLPERARADLAGQLILSLHPDAEPDVQKAWAAEIDRRLDKFEAGKAKSVPWSKVKQSILKAQRGRTRRKTLS